LKKYLTEFLIFFSTAYLIISFVVQEVPLLFWITLLLLLINYIVSLAYLFRQGQINNRLIVLNLIQLLLFCRLHVLIYDILGAEHYIYTIEPRWYDWLELVAVHVLRAVDLLDILSAYNIDLQNVKHQSMLTGIVLFSMHLMVDLFLLGALFMLLNRSASKPSVNRLPSQTGCHIEHSKKSQCHIERSEKSYWTDRFLAALEMTIEGLKKTFLFFKQIRLFVLILIVELIIFVGMIEHWSFKTGCLWFLENILRTLDFADAFQIFDWRMYQGFELATLAVLFRLIISLYLFGPLNRLFLYLSKGHGKTLEQLAHICASSDSSESEQRIAIKALTGFGAETAVPYLIDILANTHQVNIRRLVIETLGEMGRDAKLAIPHLVKLLVDNDSGIRWDVSIALEERIEPQWVAHPDVIESIPYFINALSHHERQIRCTAAEILGKIGPPAVIATPYLVMALVDDCSHVRYTAAEALKKIDPHWLHNKTAHRAIPHLIKTANRQQDVFCCAIAVEILIKMVPDSKFRHLIPYFITALVDKNQTVVRRATTALHQIDSQWAQSQEAQEALPALVKALADKNPSVQQRAGEILKKIDPTANKTVPALLKVLTENPQVGRWITVQTFQSLTAIVPKWAQSKGTHQAIRSLIETLQNHVHDYRSRKIAIETLGKMGNSALKVLPYLVVALVDDNHQIRQAANDALTQLDPQWARRKQARRGIPYLIKALEKTEHHEIGCIAVEVLGRMGPGAESAVPHLMTLLTRMRDEQILWATEAALHKIDPMGRLRKKLKRF
jgi:HEAT repeat protein